MNTLLNHLPSTAIQQFVRLFSIGYLLVLFISTVLDNALAKDLMHLLVLLGIVYYFTFEKYSLSSVERRLIGLGLLIFLYALFSYFYHPNQVASGPKLEIQGKYALFLPILFLLKQARFKLNHFVILNASLVIIAGLFAVYHYFQGVPVEKSGLRKIPYANLTLVSACVCLAAIALFKTKPIRCLLLAITVLGLFVSLWAGARGGWAAIPILAFWLAVYLNIHLSKPAWLIAIIMLLVTLTLALIPNLPVNEALERTYRNVAGYFTGVESAPDTSIGLRFEMWKAGWLAIQEKPILGLGIGGGHVWYQQLIDEGILRDSVSQFKHFHNGYIEALAVKGIAGFILEFALIFTLIRYYYQHSQHSDREIKFLGISGVLLMSGFLVFNLSDSFFALTVTLGYLLVFSCSSIYLIEQKKRQIN